MKRGFGWTLAAAAALGGCAGRSTLIRPLEGARPEPVAVLPVDGDGIPPSLRRVARRLVGSFLVERGYAKLDDAIVDRALAAAGVRAWPREWPPDDGSLAQVGRTLGARALLLVQAMKDERYVAAGVYFRRTVSAHARLIDVATERTVWAARVEASSSGGPLLAPGQLIKAVVATVDSSSDLERFRLVSTMALDSVSLLPPGRPEREAPRRPELESLDVRVIRAHGGAPNGDSDPAVVLPGDAVEITARGEPGGRVSASHGPTFRDYAIFEEEPGVYRGRVRVEPGAGERTSPVHAALYDVLGNASERRDSARRIELRAPRLEAPQSVVAELVDGDPGRMRLRWEPAHGAVAYSVVRLADPPVVEDAGASLEWEGAAPASGGDFVVFARDAASTWSLPSSPVAVPAP